MSIYDKSSLVLIPSGTKTGKVFSQKPVSGDGDFTFTRSSAATRVNADGNIEKETQNLLYQSNNFSSGFWTTSSSSVTGGQSDKDGGTDAWLITKTGSHGRIEQNISASGVQTLSVYAKAGTSSWLRLVANTANFQGGYFDLSNGVTGNTENCIDTEIEDIGSGWYRCSVIFNGSTTRVRIYPAESNSSSATSGDIYIQDAQLEQGLVARDYIDTTTPVYGGITDNTPRLDYTDSSCPALLLEPQRTNLVDYSEYYDLFHQNVTLTTNADTSPEGVDNASKIVVSSTSQPRIERFNTWSNSTTYTMSGYVKADTGRYIGFGLYSPEMGNQWVRFDLTNETFVYSDTNWSNAAIVDAGDDWYRLSATMTTDAVNSSRSGFKLATMQSNSYNTGTIGDSFFVYGLQIELGTYATSYIPTYGSSVTRVAESNSATGITDLIGQTEGTFFAEFEHNGFNGPISQNALYTRAAGSTSNYMYINVYNGRINIGLRVNSTTLFDTLQGPNPLSAGVHKCAFAYKSGDIVIYLDGQNIYVPSNNVYSNLSLAELGVGNNTTGGNQLGDGLKQVLVFKTRLSNEELADLTTI